MAEHKRCTVCHTPSTQHCAACKVTSYCSRACQREDWCLHKLICNSFREMPKRPDGNYKRCLLFPTRADAPQFVWVECKMKRGDDGVMEDIAIQDPYLAGGPGVKEYNTLGTGVVTTGVQCVNVNSYRRLHLGHTLVFTFRDTFMMDGSPSNSSITQVTRGLAPFDWRGNVLVMRQRGQPQDSLLLDDMTHADARSAADYFIAYGNSSAFAPKPAVKPVMVKAVKVACDGESNWLDGRYTQVKLSTDHPLFSVGLQPPRICELVGLPVLVHKLPLSKALEGQTGAYDNQDITFLHMDVNPSSSGWGWAPMEWCGGSCGSCLVVRADKGNLSVGDVQALCVFAHNVLQPLFEQQLESGDALCSKPSVLARITPAIFAEFRSR